MGFWAVLGFGILGFGLTVEGCLGEIAPSQTLRVRDVYTHVCTAETQN